MKKILLATTTLIGAAGLFSGAALADTPKVTVGGYANFQAGYVSDDMDGPTTATQLGQGAGVSKQRPHAFRSETQIAFRIDGKSDAGLGYGGEISLLADTSADVLGRGEDASRTLVYLEGSNWGRFEMGSTVGATSTMRVGGSSVARATGGINGSWTYWANAGDQFLAMSTLPLEYGTLTGTDTNNYTGSFTEENLNKVTYYTPRFAGFQLGVSYMPDETNRGQGVIPTTSATSVAPAGPNRLSSNAGLSDNIFAGGLNYDNKFGDVGVTAAATAQWGNAQVAGYEDLKAWNAGLKFSYMGFSLAGSYGDWGKSNTSSASGSKDTWYWDVGVAYEYGPFGASVTYLNSKFDCGTTLTADLGATGSCSAVGTNKFDNISVGVDYKLAPGLTPYAEVSWFDQDSANTATTSRDNKGVVGLVGTQLNF